MKLWITCVLDVNVLSGGWHRLILQISSRDLSLRIGSTETKLTAYGLPSSFGRAIYFGQSPKIFTAILVGTSLSYEGCIRRIAINGIPSPLKDARRSSFATPLPSPGCQMDKCSSSSVDQCSGNGQCFGNSSGLFCHCDYGYRGASCENCKSSAFCS